MESLDNGLERTKQEEWDAMVEKVERIVDGLGKHIDEGIKESVVAINAYGFGTTGSCEGHLDRGYPYPWVDVGSQLAEHNNSLKSRYRFLWKGLMKERQGGEEMDETEKLELKEIVELETAANVEVLEKLSELLDDFNQSSENDTVRLELKENSRSKVRLQPLGVPAGSPQMIKEELAKLSEEEIVQNLNLYRDEMDRFAKFLKDRFFS